MNLLITGANGQLGNEMRVLASRYAEHTFVFTDVQELDITDRSAVMERVREVHADCIVNCAAYTHVDNAEDDEATAFRLNAEAVANLGLAAAETGALMIHISTDYVFDGTACRPYRETDPVAPATAYGRTKLEGERMLFDVCPDALVIRTAWLYSSFGNNFVKTMLRLGRERDRLSVVFDQIGTPTYAADLAQAIMQIVQTAEQSGKHPQAGVYHFSNEGVCSWYDFTKQIHRLAGIESCEVTPIRSEEYPAKTPRPHYSVLDKRKIKDTFSLKVPYWTDSLARCITLLEGEG